MAPQRVLLEGLNYGQIIPETLDSEIRLVKFQPVAAVNQLLPGVQVRFQLQGTGFLDPYSTYLRFTVQCADSSFTGDEMKFVDRSAQSFISRLYITSNGVEIERIDDYDIISNMINDTLYSSEQNCFHSFEGMPSQNWYYGASTVIPPSKMDAQTAPAEVTTNRAQFTSDYYRRSASMLSSGAAASTNFFQKVGEPCFFAGHTNAAAILDQTIRTGSVARYQMFNALQGDHISSTAASFLTTASAPDLLTYDYISNGQQRSRVAYTESAVNATTGTSAVIVGNNQIQFSIPLYSSVVGVLMPQKRYIPLHVLPLDIEFTLSKTALYSSSLAGNRDYSIVRMEILSHVLFFYNDIPRAVDEIVANSGIYLHLNNFYRAPVTTIGDGTVPGTAQIQMSFNAVNSVHWVFIYQGYASNAYQRKLHFVSHNLSYMYILNGTFQIPNEPIQSLGTSNGTAGNNIDNSYIVFIVELMKAWGKLHDPSVDCGIFGNNFCTDSLGIQAQPMSQGLYTALAEVQAYTDAYYQILAAVGTDPSVVPNTGYGYPTYGPKAYSMAEQFCLQLVQKQGNVGRAQYGISLEGEQLGEVKTAITGRKIVLPFNVQLQGTKLLTTASDMFTFLRYDSILNIKPDLSIQLTR